MGEPSTSKYPADVSSKERKSRTRTIIVVGVVLVIIIIVAGLAASNFGGPNNGPRMIIASGTQYLVDPGNHRQIAFSVERCLGVQGNFTATQPTELYLMTSSQYSSFVSGNPSGAPSDYLGAFGQGAFLFLTLPAAGDYYAVFYNQNKSSSSTVTVTQAFMVGNYSGFGSRCT